MRAMGKGNLPIDGPCVDYSGHARPWCVADGEGADIAFVVQAVLAEGGVYASALDVAFRIGDWLSVWHVTRNY